MPQENSVLIKQIKENRRLYERYSELIDREILKRKAKWHLTAINYIDFDDISQLLRTHIAKKIHLYDQEKSAFVNWLNTLISNQIKNLLRNYYGSFSKCCNKCSAADGEDGCAIYGKQGLSCPEFYNWNLSKKNAYNIKLPLPTENHFNEVMSLSTDSINIDNSTLAFHKKILLILKSNEAIIYKLLYIDHKNDNQAASIFLKKNLNSITKKDLKSIENIKTKILVTARNLVYSGDIDISGE